MGRASCFEKWSLQLRSMKGKKKGSAPEGGNKESRLLGEQNSITWSRAAENEKNDTCYAK